MSLHTFNGELSPQGLVAPSRLTAVLASGLAHVKATDAPKASKAKVDVDPALVARIVGVLQMDPDTLLTLYGLIQLLQLCQARVASSVLRCNDKDIWRPLLQYAQDSTRLGNEYDVGMGYANGTIVEDFQRVKNRDIIPLQLVAEVDRAVQTQNLSDGQAAALYKREFINYVIYRSLYGESTDLNPPKIKDGYFNLVFFQAQVEIFLRYTKGSISRVLEEIKRQVKDLKKKNPNYPLIPSGFFVTAVQMVATITSMSKPHQKNRIHIPDLIAAIKEKDFY
jgi:hypothetical protein